MDSVKNQLPIITLIVCFRPASENKKDFRSLQFRDSPILVFGDHESSHSTHLLVWCNNEEKKNVWCTFCRSNFHNTTGYYICNESIGCRDTVHFHKECIEPMVNNLYHPKHPLQVLIFKDVSPNKVCYFCNSEQYYFHYCSICNFSICFRCAAKPPLLTIDHKKRHEHTLSYIPREASMTCDVCALDDRRYCLYICHQCDFLVHKECIYSPSIIKISRHEHRLSFTYSFVPRKWFCGICRDKFDENYGGYSCVKGCDYVVHSKCATHEDVWDGKELEGEPEDVYEDITPFKEISDGIIQHFSHNHHMKLHKEFDKENEEKNCCQICALPAYNGDVFSCTVCYFVLHKTCAYFPLKKHHELHLHPLVLKKRNRSTMFDCSACNRACNTFGYISEREFCYFELDVHCASRLEPLDHHCHPHLLFQPSRPGLKRRCSICQQKEFYHLDCGECDFALCFGCATLPKEFMYKHHEHPLIFSYEQDSNGQYWCDVCENEINPKNGIYMCNDCDITLHIDCLLGREMYMLPGKLLTYDKQRMNILPNNRLTRYICEQCHKHCQNKIVYQNLYEDIYCSMDCLFI